MFDPQHDDCFDLTTCTISPLLPAAWLCTTSSQHHHNYPPHHDHQHHNCLTFTIVIDVCPSRLSGPRQLISRAGVAPPTLDLRTPTSFLNTRPIHPLGAVSAASDPSCSPQEFDQSKPLSRRQPCSKYRYDILIVDISPLLKNIDISINIDMVIFENIDIDKAIL